MLLTAWLVGDEAESIMNDLTAPNGYPPAQVWVPLDTMRPGQESRLPPFRSAWATRTTNGEEWVDFALSGQTIAEAVGPQALADPKTLNHGSALASNMRERDGVLEVKVPQYYATVCQEWFEATSDSARLITHLNDSTSWSTAARVHMYWSLRTHPALIIDRAGPRLRCERTVDFVNAAGRVEESQLVRELSQLPPTTIIRCIEYIRADKEIGL